MSDKLKLYKGSTSAIDAHAIENGSIYASTDGGGISLDSGGSRIALAAQSDWNQNDETAINYVKNRTHYTEQAFTEAPLSWWDGEVKQLDFASTTTTIQGGTRTTGFTEYPMYRVVWDNEVYDLEPRLWEAGMAHNSRVGNDALAPDGYNTDGSNLDGGNTGEPFLIIFREGGMLMEAHISENSGTHSFNVMGLNTSESIVQLDEKYIPDTIARTSEVALKSDLDWTDV